MLSLTKSFQVKRAYEDAENNFQFLYMYHTIQNFEKLEKQD